MKRIHLLVITVFTFITPSMVLQAQETRGYVAIGGEWLLVPGAIVISLLCRQIGIILEQVINYVKMYKKID